ncbi:MAG: sigma-70 family RNA polymerase sigma factor [Planctomycetota bacterium]|nr:sigma-70 family RNA polymerase sigma factor [Planctomycetota bacterium]
MADAERDLELMRRFQAGDVDAFTELYEAHLRGLLNFFFRLCWDRSLAEDFAQEVLLRIYKSASKWEPNAKFTTYLYRIARNYWIDHCRLLSTQKENVSLDAKFGSSEDSGSLIDRLPDDIRPPEHDLDRRELYGAIMKALEQLPDEQRMVFVLSEIEELKYNEIAEIMEIPLGTVKSRMHTAIGKLQELLGDYKPLSAEL